MSVQYGFYFDSDRCTGCKTCELACKDYKDLDTNVNFRRIYEYAGGDWQQQANGCWQHNVLLIIYRFPVITATILLVCQFVQRVQCIKQKMALSS